MARRVRELDDDLRELVVCSEAVSNLCTEGEFEEFTDFVPKGLVRHRREHDVLRGIRTFSAQA